jgi:hypothetical protein
MLCMKSNGVEGNALEREIPLVGSFLLLVRIFLLFRGYEIVIRAFTSTPSI